MTPDLLAALREWRAARIAITQVAQDGEQPCLRLWDADRRLMAAVEAAEKESEQ